MEERELTAEELYQIKIDDEFKRLKNLPRQELVLTEEQIKVEQERQQNILRKTYIMKRLTQLSNDFVQVIVGAQIEDVDARILEFRNLHNELRVLQGKEPRLYEECIAKVKAEVEV